MKNNSKGIIDKYTTCYDIDIIVASKSVELSRLQKLCIYADGVELDNAICDGCATTTRAVEKLSGKPVCIVKFNKNATWVKTKKEKLSDLINIATHEAIHVVLDIYEYIGTEKFPREDNQEHMAYFVATVTQQIFNTLSKHE